MWYQPMPLQPIQLITTNKNWVLRPIYLSIRVFDGFMFIRWTIMLYGSSILPSEQLGMVRIMEVFHAKSQSMLFAVKSNFCHRFQFLWFSFVLCLFFYILYDFANKAGIHIHTKSQTSQYNQQLMWDHFEYVVIQMWKVCATQFFMVFNDMSFGIFPNRYDLSHLQRVWLRTVVLVLLSNADTIFDLFLSPFNSKKNVELFSCSFYIVEMKKKLFIRCVIVCM